jgi:hypothetical protein
MDGLENQGEFSEVEREKDDLVVGRGHNRNGVHRTRAKAEWSGSYLSISYLFQVV